MILQGAKEAAVPKKLHCLVALFVGLPFSMFFMTWLLHLTSESIKKVCLLCWTLDLFCILF